MDLTKCSKLLVHQIFEGWELLGYETRNKYEILDENKNKVGFAAEQQKGFLAFIMRQFLGHWREYKIHFFDKEKKEFMIAHHPFKFFFQRFEISDMKGNLIGVLQQRFSILSKKFDVLSSRGHIIMEMNSPLWKPWTYPFYRSGREMASVKKKWSGALTEIFTDKDQFLVEFSTYGLDEHEKKLILATSVFIDLQYFEKKARNN